MGENEGYGKHAKILYLRVANMLLYINMYIIVSQCSLLLLLKIHTLNNY